MTDTLIVLDSSRDSITFTPTGADVDAFGAAPLGGAFLYDDESLDYWYALPKPQVNLARRANAHGSFGLGQVFTDAATPKIIGRFLGLSADDAERSRNRLAAMFNDGRAIVMRVTTPSTTESRVVWVTDFDPDWTATETFTFTLSLVAPDARRYGPLVETPGVGLPTPSTGLVWPLGSSRGTTVSESDLKLVEQGPSEAVILSLAAKPGDPVTVVMQAGMVQNGVIKSGTLRVRDGSLTGTVLGSYALTDKGDDPSGTSDTWTWTGTVGPSGTVALTGQTNFGTLLYSASRSITAGPVLYFDWGSAGTSGTITLTNAGNATAFPTIYVGGNSGGFPDGFRVQEVETGAELTFPFAVPPGTVLAINNRTRRVTQDSGGDVTELLTSRQWASVPPGTTRTYAISTLGNIQGAPTFRATMMPANL